LEYRRLHLEHGLKVAGSERWRAPGGERSRGPAVERMIAKTTWSL
jgi:hypothetical protein